MPMHKLVILIPCYNEEESIANVIEKVPVETLRHLGLETEIIVINNNSTDATRAVAEKAGARVIDERQKGKGNAMRRGFMSLPADTKYVVMLDGDDTYHPSEVVRLVEPLQSGFCKVIIGSRLGGRMQHSSMNRVSRLGNWLFTHMVRQTYKVSVTDVLTGYFAWTKEAIDDLAPHLRSNGFAIEMEMITKMARLKYEIFSVPISYHPRIGSSNLRPFYDGIRILKMFITNLRWQPERREHTSTANEDVRA
jgi:dolichol-phosphate hexosyltransferase